MSQMTLADLNTLVRLYIPDRPQASIAAAANMVLQRIFNRISVPERSTFTTKAKNTSFTVTTTTDSTAITFSGNALSATDPMAVVQISGVQEWFDVTRVTDSTGTLSSKWPLDGAAGLSCTIAYPCITYPADVLSVKRRWQEGYKELTFAGDEKQEAPLGWYSAPGITAGRLSPGRPIWWAPFSMDTSGSPDDLRRELIIPWPDRMYVLEYSYVKRPVLFTPAGADTQKTWLPAIWDQAIKDGTLFHSWVMERKRDVAEPWRLDYERSFREALAELGPVSRLGDGGAETGVWIEEQWPVGG